MPEKVVVSSKVQEINPLQEVFNVAREMVAKRLQANHIRSLIRSETPELQDTKKELYKKLQEARKNKRYKVYFEILEKLKAINSEIKEATPKHHMLLNTKLTESRQAYKKLAAAVLIDYDRDVKVPVEQELKNL